MSRRSGRGYIVCPQDFDVGQARQRLDVPSVYVWRNYDPQADLPCSSKSVDQFEDVDLRSGDVGYRGIVHRSSPTDPRSPYAPRRANRQWADRATHAAATVGW